MSKTRSKELDYKDKLYTVSEVAEMLNVHKLTVLRWIKENRIKAIRLPSGRLRIPKEEVDKILVSKVERS